MKKKPVSAAGVIGTVADLARFEAVGCRRIGLGLAFDRLWRDIGCQAAVRVLAPESEHDFEMERVVFWAVLRRISRSGRYAAPPLDDREEVPGLRDADRRYLRQAIEWLGAPLGETAPAEGMPAPCAVKDRIEEELFAGRRRRSGGGMGPGAVRARQPGRDGAERRPAERRHRGVARRLGRSDLPRPRAADAAQERPGPGVGPDRFRLRRRVPGRIRRPPFERGLISPWAPARSAPGAEGSPNLDRQVSGRSRDREWVTSGEGGGVSRE